MSSGLSARISAEDIGWNPSPENGSPMARRLSYPLPLDLADLPTREERSERTAELLRRRATAGPDEQRELVAEIVRLNRGVAVALAMRYRGRGVALDDLCQ